jgi:hypothetical protein
VSVYRGDGRFVVEWPDGRRREFLNGSCEFAPHDPKRDYPPEDVQSWKGTPEFKGARNA